MKYLHEGIGEITKEAFEAILGPNIKVVQPAATEGFIATIDALEVTSYDASTSSVLYLSVGPPAHLNVVRQNAGYLEINDWKFENGKHFCPVEIGGGKYDAGAGQVGPFTISLNIPNTFVVSGVGWKAGTNHQHPNIYATLRFVEPPVDPPVDPPPIDPPPVDPPPVEVKQLIIDAKLDLTKANLRLDEALRLLQ